MEATGTSGEALATYLFDAGHRVSVVNPAVIKAYAQSHHWRAKTDKVAATLIARFCAERKPPAWHPVAREVRESQALVRRLESLLEMRQMEVNRLQAGVSAQQVRDSLSEDIAFLDEEIKRTTALIRQHIELCPMQIIGGAMRKLMHIAYGVLKSGRPFDPALAKTA